MITDDMIRTIFPSTEKLKQIVKNDRNKHGFPWSELECGQSFKVELSIIKLSTLRSKATQKGQQLQRKFRVVIFDDHYEVGRIK